MKKTKGYSILMADKDCEALAKLFATSIIPAKKNENKVIKRIKSKTKIIHRTTIVTKRKGN